MTITTLTIDGNDYKSYASVDESDNALAIDPIRGPTWAALSEDNKKKHLAAATRRFNVLNWRGEKAGGPTQDDAWPRIGLTYSDGTEVPDNVVPGDIELATILLAGSVAQDAANANLVNPRASIRKVKAGSAEVEFSESTRGVPRTNAQNQVADPAVHALVRKWLEGSSASYGLASGTDGESCFSELNPYGTRQY